jgi:DNA polymerase-3 subunit beta
MTKPTTTPQSRQFQIQQSELNRALQICGRALDTNNILPINSMFLFDLKPNVLTISACNMYQSISTSLNLSNELSFSIAIPGNKLKDYIAKCKPELLVFTINEHVTLPTETAPETVSYSVTIASGSNPKNNCNMPCEPGENFPVIKNTPTAEFELPAADFLEALYKTMFAISDDQLRPSATGLNVEITGKKITYTGLNFNMCSTYAYPVENLPDTEIIIPKKSLQLIQSLSPTGQLSIIVGDAITISFNGIETRSRLIDEKYPDYKSVMPTGNNINFVTSRPDLLASLKRIMPFRDFGKLVKLNISTASIELIAENIDFSEEAKEEIPGALPDGSPILIGLNGDYLLDLLNSFTESEIWFNMSAPNKAITCTDGSIYVESSKENLVLLMPLLI